MISFLRTDSDNREFLALVKELDKDLAIRDGNDREFYNQFNKLDAIKNVIIAYEDKVSAGCGAIKKYSADTMEVKRMFVPLSLRGKGIAAGILKELEKWTIELGYTNCILETGKRQPEAISLYKKCGYEEIPNYGQYVNIENSVCFLKSLK